MITQVIFKLDKKLKNRAAKKARQAGITLTDFYKHATKSFLDGRLSIGVITTPEIPNAKTAREWDGALKDIKEGKNLSPAFDNAQDAIAYLKNYVKNKKNVR